jgi:hypothetical protein
MPLILHPARFLLAVLLTGFYDVLFSAITTLLAFLETHRWTEDILTAHVSNFWFFAMIGVLPSLVFGLVLGCLLLEEAKGLRSIPMRSAGAGVIAYAVSFLFLCLCWSRWPAAADLLRLLSFLLVCVVAGFVCGWLAQRICRRMFRE